MPDHSAAELLEQQERGHKDEDEPVLPGLGDPARDERLGELSDVTSRLPLGRTTAFELLDIFVTDSRRHHSISNAMASDLTAECRSWDLPAGRVLLLTSEDAEIERLLVFADSSWTCHDVARGSDD